MNLLTEKIIKELLLPQTDPCLSLYLPTHRTHPDNIQDPIRYRHLVKELEESLATKYTPAEVLEYLEPFEALKNDKEFWQHTLDGVAIFSTKGYWQVVNLPIVLSELAIVADSFHTKPLRQYLQSADRFHILGLSLHEVQLFEGNQHSIHAIELSGEVPTTIEEALGNELTEKHTTVASYGGTSGESSTMRHGHGGKKEETDVDAERFFRVIASAVHENYSKPTGLPLILAALPEHHNLFQSVSNNPFLLENGIDVYPASVSMEQLKVKAWDVVEPEYMAILDAAVEKYENAKAHEKGSDVIKEVAVAAVEGRVDTLLIEANRVIAMRITNLVTGNTQNKDLLNPKVDDLLDDMGELVLKMGGQVVVMPADKIPSETGLAAIYRY